MLTVTTKLRRTTSQRRFIPDVVERTTFYGSANEGIQLARFHDRFVGSVREFGSLGVSDAFSRVSILNKL